MISVTMGVKSRLDWYFNHRRVYKFDQIAIFISIEIHEIINLPSLYAMYHRRRDRPVPANANTPYFIHPQTMKKRLYGVSFRTFPVLWKTLQPWLNKQTNLKNIFFCIFCAREKMSTSHELRNCEIFFLKMQKNTKCQLKMKQRK